MTRMQRRIAPLHLRHNRITTWARTTQVISLAANGNYVAVDLLANFKADGGVQQGCTITRTHINMCTTNATASGDAFSWGLLVAQNTDLGASLVGAPVPDADPYEDWSWWRFETACANTGGASAYWPYGNVVNWDVKSQRKLDQIQQVYALIIKRQTVAAATLNLTVTVSTLLKLP